MDMENYCNESDLTELERLLTAERVRTEGLKGYTVDEFCKNMCGAIEKGSGVCNKSEPDCSDPQN